MHLFIHLFFFLLIIIEKLNLSSINKNKEIFQIQKNYIHHCFPLKNSRNRLNLNDLFLLFMLERSILYIIY